MQPGDEARILQVKNWWFAVTCNVWVLFSEITILMIIMFSQPASLVYHKANEKSTALHDCETWAIESGPFDEITTWSHSVFCQVDDFQQRVPLTSTLEFTFLEGGHNKETSCDSHKTLFQWVWVADRQRVLHFNWESNWKRHKFQFTKCQQKTSGVPVPLARHRAQCPPHKKVQHSTPTLISSGFLQ